LTDKQRLTEFILVSQAEWLAAVEPVARRTKRTASRRQCRNLVILIPQQVKQTRNYFQKSKHLRQANKAQAEELAKLNAIDVSAIVNEKLNEFKNTLTSGKAPRQAFNTSGQVATHTHKSISEVMAEKREERKKQLNKN
jgi:hypothetical protein